MPLLQIKSFSYEIFTNRKLILVLLKIAQPCECPLISKQNSESDLQQKTVSSMQFFEAFQSLSFETEAEGSDGSELHTFLKEFTSLVKY